MTSLFPIRLLLLLSVALVVLSALAQESPQQKRPSLPPSIPWNLEELRKVPNVEWQESNTTRSLFYAGEPFEGKPKDFAYPPDSHAKTNALVKSHKNLWFLNVTDDRQVTTSSRLMIAGEPAK